MLLIFLVILGFIGSRDPLANPLSLFIWSIWFLIMPLVQIVFGNIWTFLNPWYGIGRLLFKNRYIFKLDKNLSLIFPSISFLLFSLFMLVDIAPDDPDRLANVVCIYFLLNFIFIWLFGMSWLDKGECFSVFFNMLSKLSWLQFRDGKAHFGFFGLYFHVSIFLIISFSSFFIFSLKIYEILEYKKNKYLFNKIIISLLLFIFILSLSRPVQRYLIFILPIIFILFILK